MISRLEARITIPTAGWTFTLTDSAVTNEAINLTAAATYYMSSAGNDTVDLPQKIEDLLNAASTNTYAVTLSAGVGGTGKLTIAVDSGTFSITWNDTALRNLLGFDANVSAQSSATGADQVEAIWLPAAPIETAYGLDSAGIPVSSDNVRLAPGGTYTAFHGPAYRTSRLVWRAVVLARVVAASETTVNASYEQFWIDSIRGEASWATSGRALRWYADADTDATYQEYNVTAARSPDVQRLSNDWDGLWTVSLQVATVGT